MVAAALGHSENARVVNIPLKSDTEAAYGIYDGNNLAKILVLNLKAFSETTTGSRPVRKYHFRVPKQHRHVKVERMIAPGSDSTHNVTFGGISYDYDLNHGKPVTVNPKKETIKARDGIVSIDVQDSSAVLLSWS